MERRDFLRTLVGGVAVAAAVRSWPFRVFSFPSEPVIIPAILGEYQDYTAFSVFAQQIVYYDKTVIPMMKEAFPGKTWDRPLAVFTGEKRQIFKYDLIKASCQA